MELKIKQIYRIFSNPKVFSGLLILQTVFFLFWEIWIPSDSKNAFFLGYSISRLLLLATFIVIISLISISFFPKALDKVLERLNLKKHLSKKIDFSIFLVLGFILYLLIFLPSERYQRLEAYFIRIQPLLIAVFLVIFEILLYLFWLSLRKEKPGTLKKRLKENRKIFITIGIISLALVLSFIILGVINTPLARKEGALTTNSLLTPMQFLIATIIVLVAFRKSLQTSEKQKSILFRRIAVLILIWIISLVVLRSIPLVCQNDLEGPYYPNNQCYPQSNDASLPVGSYYITLGKGVFNQWFTDKPFYMVFLAIGQLIFGDGLDNALYFQVIVLSFLPVIAYLLGKAFSNQIVGILFCTFILLLEINNILFYGYAELVNIKIPVTELLTGFLLLLLALSLKVSLEKEKNLPLLAISGGILALASLTRLNPIFIVPFVLLLLIVKNFNNKKQLLYSCVVFIFAFLLVFLPAQIVLVNEDGIPHSVAKIKSVLENRYHIDIFSADETTGGGLEDVAYTGSSISLLSTRLRNTTAEDSSLDRGKFFAVYEEEDDGSNTGVALYFLDNIYRSFAVFPVNVRLHAPDTIYNQPIMSAEKGNFFWMQQITPINAFTLIISVVIVITGLVSLMGHQGLLGSIPLLIFIGYHVGNGFALTSGGRFLQPVLWVVLFYGAIGLIQIYRWCDPYSYCQSRKNNVKESEDESLNTGVSCSVKKFLLPGFAVLIMAAAIPLASLVVPKKYTWFNQDSIKTYVLDHYEYSQKQTEEIISTYLDNPDVVVVEGFAYHPKIYDTPLFSSNDLVFEQTVVTDEKVYFSVLFNPTRINQFADGSRVVIVGCPVANNEYWGMRTQTLRTLAVFDLNKYVIYINPYYNLSCP